MRRKFMRYCPFFDPPSHHLFSALPHRLWPSTTPFTSPLRSRPPAPHPPFDIKIRKPVDPTTPLPPPSESTFFVYDSNHTPTIHVAGRTEQAREKGAPRLGATQCMPGRGQPSSIMLRPDIVGTDTWSMRGQTTEASYY